MNKLNIKQLELLQAGDDCDFHMGVSTGLMTIGIASGMTPAGAVFLLAGAGWGMITKYSDKCKGRF